MTIQKQNLSAKWHCPSIILRQQAVYTHVPADFASDNERSG